MQGNRNYEFEKITFDGCFVFGIFRERYFADEIRNRLSTLERDPFYIASYQKEGLELYFVNVRALRKQWQNGGRGQVRRHDIKESK